MDENMFQSISTNAIDFIPETAWNFLEERGRESILGDFAGLSLRAINDETSVYYRQIDVVVRFFISDLSKDRLLHDVNNWTYTPHLSKSFALIVLIMR